MVILAFLRNIIRKKDETRRTKDDVVFGVSPYRMIALSDNSKITFINKDNLEAIVLQGKNLDAGAIRKIMSDHFGKVHPHEHISPHDIGDYAMHNRMPNALRNISDITQIKEVESNDPDYDLFITQVTQTGRDLQTANSKPEEWRERGGIESKLHIFKDKEVEFSVIEPADWELKEDPAAKHSVWIVEKSGYPRGTELYPIEGNPDEIKRVINEAIQHFDKNGYTNIDNVNDFIQKQMKQKISEQHSVNQ